MVLWAKSPDYRTLYSNLSDQDGGAIVTQLTQMNIPYRFADNGGALEVPADKVHEHVCVWLSRGCRRAAR
jgi:flagellar M-ring protein FliF